MLACSTAIGLAADLVAHQADALQADIPRQLEDLFGHLEAAPPWFHDDDQPVYSRGRRPPQMFDPGLHVQDHDVEFLRP